MHGLNKAPIEMILGPVCWRRSQGADYDRPSAARWLLLMMTMLCATRFGFCWRQLDTLSRYLRQQPSLAGNVRHYACLILDHHMPNMTGLGLGP